MCLWVLQVATNAGIRITQPGVSVPYAADYQYVFNSDWPSLAIAFEAVVTIPGTTYNFPVLHGLGFFPFIQVWNTTGDINNGRVTNGIFFDKQNVYINNTTASTITYSIKCYNLDITNAKSYVLPQYPIVKTPYDSTTGIKVSKYGESIGSTDLRDFILHSRAQSPAVLAVITKSTTSNDVISYTNPAGYIPWAFAFASTDGVTYQIVRPGASQSLPAFTFSYPAGPTKGTVQLAFGNSFPGTTGQGSLVMLRDPLVVSTTKQVTY